MRRQLESTFGTLTVHEAARQVRRRPWWRGRAQRSPLRGPPAPPPANAAKTRSAASTCSTRAARRKGPARIRAQPPRSLRDRPTRPARRRGAPGPAADGRTPHRHTPARRGPAPQPHGDLIGGRDDALVTTAAAATESDAAEPLECWCCGSAYQEPELVRLGSHPEVAVCLRCAHFLHQQALGREDAQRPTPASRMRDALRSARRVVMQRQWHQKPVIGRPLRWLGRRLP